ncbi:fructosamine kinase family protein [Phormidium sp. CLA17]|uniref:fructosamine kinase family protein n=1 Tax=Leptolyngbya sp. Cla-17 TaxID=2803751 RepID=UPI00149221FA|nr:fructosamine kinase family protein [Leptolyngbya sp. Cla-17]MBM0743842.1 fructosamine kinase family protein [Leptolyngbya sp. Cla-17]
MWDLIAAHLSQSTGQLFQLETRRSVSGGCINSAYAISGSQQTYFVKLNQASQLDMFEAEAAGLNELLASQTIRVPKPICWGTTAGSAYLVLEWLDLGRNSGSAWEAMGQKLAALHQNTSLKGFGWQVNNTIGATVQINHWTRNWAEFWIEHRLGYQFGLAAQRGGIFPAQNRLLSAIPKLLAGHDLQPALVHGDLWSGNAAVTQTGEPVIFDPATYYGDREVDIAMTELFGGFPADFYRGYNAAFPLDSGYSQRKTLYNLYHVLNHFNLFGGSYAAQANRMIEQILSSS